MTRSTKALLIPVYRFRRYIIKNCWLLSPYLPIETEWILPMQLYFGTHYSISTALLLLITVLFSYTLMSILDSIFKWTPCKWEKGDKAIDSNPVYYLNFLWILNEFQGNLIHSIRLRVEEVNVYFPILPFSSLPSPQISTTYSIPEIVLPPTNCAAPMQRPIILEMSSSMQHPKTAASATRSSSAQPAPVTTVHICHARLGMAVKLA